MAIAEEEDEEEPFEFAAGRRVADWLRPRVLPVPVVGVVECDAIVGEGAGGFFFLFDFDASEVR